MRCGDYQIEYRKTIKTLKRCLSKGNGNPKLEKVAFDLKNCLSKMNNIITARLSYKFLEYLNIIGFLNPENYKRAKESLYDSDTNSTGFDIRIDGEVPILAEIKSTFPCNKNGTYGSQQRTEILNDIRGLLNGKTRGGIQPERLNEYYRFQVLLESPAASRSRDAIEQLMKEDKASDLQGRFSFLDKNRNSPKKDKINILCISL